MQTATTILFTALILSFFVIFLTPGRWWPRRPSGNSDHKPVQPNDDDDEPPPSGSGMSLN